MPLLLALLLAIEPSRPRLREWGVKIGILPAGPLDAITDVEGVRVGHATVVRSDAPGEKPSVNTGVTVVLPHGRNLAKEKVAAAVVVGNACAPFCRNMACCSDGGSTGCPPRPSPDQIAPFVDQGQNPSMRVESSLRAQR